MEDKLVTFHIYRYHLLPTDSKGKQVELFAKDELLTIDEIKERKNEFFQKVLDELVSSKSNNHPLKLEHNENGTYLFKIAQQKTTSITKNFKTESINTEPYVYVVINNDPSVQKMAISVNSEAFSSPHVVKNILRKTFRRDLKQFGLNIELEQMFDQIEFWNYVKKYQGSITYINFQYIKPNLANISKSLPQAFRNFAENTNSHESHVTIKAPENGALENIDKDNADINGMVEYTGEGAGSIKMKVKSIRKQLNTKDNPTTLQIRELDLEGPADQVIKLYKSIVE